MRNRSCPWSVAGLLIAIVVSLGGCNSGVEESEYQSFSNLPEEQKTLSSEQTLLPGDDLSSEQLSGATPTPGTDLDRAPALAQETRSATDSRDDPTPHDPFDPPPLAAIKPKLAENPKSLKENIDNVASANRTDREIRLLVHEKSFTPEGPENALRISYDDFDLLKVLNMEPVPLDAVDHFPGWLLGLDGKRVRVRGFMYPPFKEEGLEQFILARDNQICCFGKNPKIYDLVYVSMRDGVTTKYIQNRPFDVVGTFRIRPDAEGGEWFSLYELDDALVVDR
jgi:hypothetical protein